MCGMWITVLESDVKSCVEKQKQPVVHMPNCQECMLNKNQNNANN
jgi:hypothetical protein